ncbi:MAG: lysophospholipid acyltransferase family protein [Sorangiineae bacterium]|nr:lysophospholipid acyltransferase family protein [Polyangiaceae bacterium]MEB2320894.1 lysophospholipid acyltransferase family protein [Sorangiineae bacterium]
MSLYEALRPFDDSPLARLLRELPIGYFHATTEGMERLPREGGALLVGNHAMSGLDGVVLGALVRRETRRRVRFLGERNLWKIPLFRDLLDASGALPGEPNAATALLRGGELVGVYPGGIDDSWKLTSVERYTLKWGNRAGFARVAIRAGVPIFPVAATGIDEMYDVILRERFVGRRLLGSRRYDLPIALGAWGTLIPRRAPQHYRVLEPIDTSGDEGDPAVVERVRVATRDALERALAAARAAR